MEASRGSQVLKKILGDTFKGTLISDFFSAYVKYASALQQFCLAHLVRDIKFLTTLPDTANQQFGIRLLRQFKRLFYFWHLRGTMPQEHYLRALSVIQRNLRSLVSEEQLPRKSKNIANRLDKHWSSYLRFLLDPSIAPTNNLAEQTIRTVVIALKDCFADRKITQGTRSEWGRQWSLSASGPSWPLAANKNARPGNSFRIVSGLNASALLTLLSCQSQLEAGGEGYLNGFPSSSYRKKA